MRSILFGAILTLLSTSAFATETKIAVSAESSKVASVKPAKAEIKTPFDPVALVGINLIGASTGRIDARLEVMRYKFWAPMIGLSTYTEEKIRPDISTTTETTVAHTYAQVGASYYLKGTQAPTNLVLNPYWAFGSETDYLKSKSQTGAGARILGQLRASPEFLIEAGVQVDAVTSSTSGKVWLGLGSIF